MKKPLLDSNGIPVLSREDIELRTEQFIRYFDKDCLNQPSLTPLAKICTILQKEHDVTFVFDKEQQGTDHGCQEHNNRRYRSSYFYL